MLCQERGHGAQDKSWLPERTIFDSDVERWNETPPFSGEGQPGSAGACSARAKARCRMGRSRGSLGSVVRRGSAIGRAAGRLQPAAGHAEHTTRGSPGGRDRTADATSATVAKQPPDLHRRDHECDPAGRGALTIASANPRAWLDGATGAHNRKTETRRRAGFCGPRARKRSQAPTTLQTMSMRPDHSA